MKKVKKFKTFQLGIYQKTFNNSRNILEIRKFFTRISAEMYELSDDCNLPNGYPWDPMGFRFLNGSPMSDPCKALDVISSQFNIAPSDWKMT